MGWLARLFGITEKKLPVHVDAQNFEAEVLRSELPVLLDVWSPMCGPCQQLEPIVMALAARYDGRVKVAELNARDAPAIAGHYGVEGTPTVLYFLKGEVVERTVGFRGQAWHEEIIETELLAPPGA